MTGQPATASELRAKILKDVAEERARIADAEAEARASIDKKDAAYAVLADAYREEARKAREAYRPEPPAPERPDARQESALLHRMLLAKSSADEMERRALGAHRLQIETEWGRTLPVLAAAAQEALKPVEELLVTLQDWGRLLKDARKAEELSKGQRSSNGPAERMRQGLSLLDIEELAAGSDVLEPLPLPAPPTQSLLTSSGGHEEERFITRAEAARRSQNQQGGTRRWL
ncbi:hypothetical protein [Paenarthrobacter ilicis]|uniref:hypothetical protein n=1 Tax=Paenarthrobacter ilicis TaxID=43665 RepID=UPI0028D8EC86|nr:hypothetical protein [Paenarthrobacter ilicis]